MPVPGELPERPPVVLAVFVSGEGTLLEALQDRIVRGRLDARIALVVSDRKGTAAVQRAGRLGLPTFELGRPSEAGPAWSDAAQSGLTSAGVELVVLDGFLSVIPPELLARWRGRMINIHPSLLPRHGGRGMFGRRVFEEVLAAGDAETGATVHLVTEQLDGGPILEQRSLPVHPGDTPETLRERLRPVEIETLCTAIGAWKPPRSNP